MLTKKIVKYIQSLSHKKFRDEESAFIAEGPKVVAEFLSSQKMKCRLLCGSKEWLQENEGLLAGVATENIIETDQHWLERISLLKTPNKVLAVFDKMAFEKDGFQNKISLMLDDIQDPGNLGSVIRNCDWFGINHIICSESCADCYNPKVVQSTMGSLARVNIMYTNIVSFIHQHKEIPVYGAALAGQSVFEIGSLQKGIILIGNESQGIHEDILHLCRSKITIPRFGHAESLNAAVASGIILAQIKRNS